MSEICARYGKRYTKELKNKNIGGTDNEICTNVVRDLQLDVTVDELQRELMDKTKLTLPKAPLKKGVERLLNHLFQTGVLFALATNSLRSTLRLHVASRPKLFKMFHHMVCAGDPEVDRAKPFPDLYLVAADMFPDKPAPIKCLVFEDSVIGLEAGVAAGMQEIFVFELANLPLGLGRRGGAMNPHSHSDIVARRYLPHMQRGDPVVVTPFSGTPVHKLRKASLVLKSLQDFRPEDFGLPPFKDNLKKRPTS